MMQKIKLLISIFLIFSFIISCNQKNQILNKVPKKFHIGVIQTTQFSNTSYLSFYNKNYLLIGEIKIPYGDLGDEVRTPLVNGNKIDVVPLGRMGKKEWKILLELDLTTGKYKTYNIGQQGTLFFCRENQTIYTTNTFNDYGTIVECNLSTRDYDEWKMVGSSMNSLTCINGILYAWGSIYEYQHDVPYLFIFQTNPLRLLKKIIIEDKGSTQLASLRKSNDLYFTNMYQADGETENNILSKFNLETYTIVNIRLKEYLPYQIFDYANKLYITHCNPILHIGNKLTIYDPNTAQQQIINLKNVLIQCFIDKGFLYSHDGEDLYIYDMQDLKLVNKVHINLDRKSNQKFYIGGFFMNPESAANPN